MKLFVTSAVVALLISGIAYAQSPGSQGGAVGGAAAGAVGGAIVAGPVGAVIGGAAGAAAGGALGSISTDDRTYIQTHVYQQKVSPVTVKEQIVIGKPLPATIKTTYAFEGRNTLKNYRYAYVNGQYLLIDSKGNVLGSIQK